MRVQISPKFIILIETDYPSGSRAGLHIYLLLPAGLTGPLGYVFGYMVNLSPHRRLHGYNGPSGEYSKMMLRLPSSDGLAPHPESTYIVFKKIVFFHAKNA